MSTRRLDYGSGGEIRDDFIPSDRYRSSETFELEQENLWPRVWQIACREEEVPDVGSYALYEILDESIIIARSSEQEIKAYYNVCQHRGRRLVDKPRGRLSNFYCRFHGWRFSLDGECIHVYSSEDWSGCPAFDQKELTLKSPQVDRWSGWVWINLDPDAAPLRDYLGLAAEKLDPFDFHELRYKWWVTIHAPVNWKVVMEAFHEGYHSAATHSTRLDYEPMVAPAVAHGDHAMYFTDGWKSLSRFKTDQGAWQDIESMPEFVYQQAVELHEDLEAMVLDPLMTAIRRMYEETPADASPETVSQKIWELHKEELEATGAKWPEKLTPEHMASAGTSWHLFPNTIVLPNPDGVLWYRMRPDRHDPDRCIFDIWCLARYAKGKEPKVEPIVFDGFEEARDANTFLSQDFDNMLAVNEGMKSRGWSGARANPVQEVCVVNFHRALDRYLLAK
ncbi:MAG: aromatic ring-hydroxylating dioxygenase subunit alpha [Deltaproteobacteria bacterium]|jgi:phenylpropionate dioxygenase-like ring-hydroxylating dioxygenase large terminal subunit|nr:aromatic ring-hydroxylating dioxygenase subunit alpha [Deltaproteobacteria bacterium]